MISLWEIDYITPDDFKWLTDLNIVSDVVSFAPPIKLGGKERKVTITKYSRVKVYADSKQEEILINLKFSERIHLIHKFYLE